MADPAAARAAATDLAAASLLSDEEQTTVLNGASAQISAFQDQRRVQIWMPVGRVLAFVVHDGPSETALGEAIRLAGAHAGCSAPSDPPRRPR